MLRNAQRHSCKRGDIEISYLEWSHSDDLTDFDNDSASGQQAVLLLHGLADCAVVWTSLGDYLTTQYPGKYHVVAPDLRGHGESSKPATGYDAAEIIADLAALMTHLKWQEAHILGHSWGGKLAAIWATSQPQKFSSLILVDPFYINRLPNWSKVTFPLLYRVLPFLQGMGPFVSKARAIELAKKLKQYRQWTPLQEQSFLASIEAKPDGTWGSKFIVAARNQIFTDVMQRSGLVESLSITSLFIQPTKGLNRTQWQLEPFERFLPNLSIKQVEGNHWVFLVNPEAFNQEIAQFLHLVTCN
ncbi:MAG: alpha/beta hydrolase [Cyanobacteria bacterium J06621_8]